MQMFGDRLADAVRRKQTPAVVGIDPRADLLPCSIVARYGLGLGASKQVWAAAVEEFCARVLDIVGPLVPAVKFQSAFFEQLGATGVATLEVLLRRACRGGLMVILDAKRGDIGTTSEAYAEAAFGKLAALRATGGRGDGAADALTVSPYLGKDSLEPFLDFAREGGRGLFVLVRTSNPGSRDLQHLSSVALGQPVYRHVADWVREWSEVTRGAAGYGSVGAVVGGTAGVQIAELRAAMPGAWLLIPGYGAQGATAADIAPAFDERGLGAIVNNSRGILFPKIDGDPDAPGAWERAVEAALKRMIDDLSTNTPARGLKSK
jgi:orotidine-5'-phosphate decarboxylase